MKSYIPYAVFLICLLATTAYTQPQTNPVVMEQIRSALSAKGLTEAEVKARLNQKGINVDAMSNEQIIQNRPAIEATINELEAEKKAMNKQDSTRTKKPSAITTKKPVQAQLDKNKAVLKLKADSLLQREIYGHSVLRDTSINIYRISKDVSPPDSYVLGTGDKINILIFGKSQADLLYEINDGGFITPNLMPKIFVSGLTLKQAKELLLTRFSSQYLFNRDQFAITLNTSRTLNVNIFGEVGRVGSYTTSALNTVLTALAASGGPSDFGTVRNIQLIRGGKKKILDIYDFMRDPVVQFDFFLQNNDMIFVPPADIIVSISGPVNRPMRYELKKGETVADLIRFAGGLRPDAYTGLLQVKRTENNVKILRDYNLQDLLDKKISLEFHNGDEISIKEVNYPLKSIVSVTGAVKYAGVYDLISTPTLKALLAKAVLTPESNTEHAYISRKSDDQTVRVLSVSIDSVLTNKVPDFVFEREDAIQIFDRDRFVDDFPITVIGEVREPFERRFRLNETLTVAAAIELAGGLKVNATEFGYIFRTDPLNSKKTTYLLVELKGEGEKTKLYPGDRLIILNRDLFVLDASINIAGDVRTPQELRFDPSLTIADLIRIGGGMTRSSDSNFVEVFRLNLDFRKPVNRTLFKVALDNQYNAIDPNFSLQPFDIVVVRTLEFFALQEMVNVYGEVRKSGTYAIRDKGYRLSDLVKDANGLTNYADERNIMIYRNTNNRGMLAFNARKSLSNPGSRRHDPVLLNGDSIMIPKLINTVSIRLNGTNYQMDSTQSILNLVFQGQKSSRWYIRNFAGGFAENSDRKTVSVRSVNGMTKGTKQILIFRNMPDVQSGDLITLSTMPPKVKSEDKSKFDFDRFTSRVLSIFTTLALIRAYSN